MAGSELVIVGLVWYLVFVFSTVCHEAAHALVAKWGGDLTAFQGGQVTLDPRPHIKREPIGMILVPLLTWANGSGWMMGWASAPYDGAWANRHPRRAGLMSLAGPAANLLLALTAGVLIRVGVETGYLAMPVRMWDVVEGTAAGASNTVALFLAVAFRLNIILGVFNLLPVPPLDGTRVLTLFLPEDATRAFIRLTQQPWVGLVGLILAWRFGGVLVGPAYRWGMELVYLGL